MTFMPVLWVQKGHTIVSAGVLFSIFTISGTVSGILCGHLSDRMGYKRLLWITHGLMTPFLLVFLLVPGKWIYPATILAGGFNMASIPIGVVMAQKIAPKGRSMVSSIVIGLALGIAGLLMPLAGRMADAFGIRSTLSCIAFIPLAVLLLIRFLPEPDKKG